MRSFELHPSIPAGASTNDVITASGINAQFSEASNVTLYQNGDSAGLLSNLSFDTGSSSTGIIPSGSSVGVASTVGKIKTNEDFVTQFAVPAGVKLVLNVQNPTGGNINYNALLVIT